MIKCLIVDDDKVARLEIEQLVKKTSFLKHTGSCDNATDAFNIITDDHIDLLFLDVLMPGMSGLDLIKNFKDKRPQVILVTANKKYALDAFEFDVTDFLVKPVSPERFLKAVTKAKERHERKKKSDNDTRFIFVKVESKLVKIFTDDIYYLESFGDYIHIHLENKRLTIHSTMKAILEKLPPRDFMRVHNSYAIRLDKISSIEGSTLVINKNLIPVSRTFQDELMKRLNLV